MSDRDNEEGTGLRLGDLELHPGIGILGGYETNPFFRDEQDTGGPEDGVVDAAAVRISPHLDIATLSQKRRADSDEEIQAPTINFRGGLSGIVNYYAVEGQEPTIEGRVDLREEILPERPFTLLLLQEASQTRIPIQGGNQFNTHLGAGIFPQLSTPGGLLKAKVGYKFSYDFFTEDLNNNFVHLISEQVSWEFLPKTALFQEVELGLQLYENELPPDAVNNLGQGAGATDKNDITRVTGRAGVNGALTKEIAMTLSGGVTSAWVQGASDDKAPIVQAQLRWRPVRTFRMMLDGSMSSQNALQGNTVNRIAGGLRGELTMGGAAVLRAGAKLEHLQYGDDTRQLALREQMVGLTDRSVNEFQVDPALAYNTDPRTDLKLTLEASGEYRFTSWLALSLEVAYLTNDSDYFFLTRVEEDGSPADNPNSAAYDNFRVYAGLRAFL